MLPSTFDMQAIAPKQKHLVATYYRIDPPAFHFLKFILEGYDNLAVISSVPQHEGVIRLLCASESLEELQDILASVAIRIKRIEF